MREAIPHRPDHDAAGLQPDHVVAGSKCVRRAGHRLDGDPQTPPLRGFERVTRVDHQVRESRVGPERDLPGAVRRRQHRASTPVLVPDEPRVRRVEPGLPDGASGAEVERRPLDGHRRPCRKAPFVDDEPLAGRHVQLGLVDLRPDCEVGMEPQAEWSRAVGEVGHPRGSSETVLIEPVLHAEIDPPGIARLRMQDAPKLDGAFVLRHDAPGKPPDEPMDRVAALGLVERRATRTTLELVAAPIEPVGPGRQNLTSARRGGLLDREPVEHVDATDRVGAKRGAHLARHKPLIPGPDLILLTRRGEAGRVNDRRSACPAAKIDRRAPRSGHERSAPRSARSMRGTPWIRAMGESVGTAPLPEHPPVRPVDAPVRASFVGERHPTWRNLQLGRLGRIGGRQSPPSVRSDGG